MKTKLLFAAAAVAALAWPSLSPAADTGSTTAPHYGTWGYDEGGRNAAVKPGDDFFQYANGTALTKMEIPTDRVRFGNFDVLTVLSENRVHAILDGVAARPAASLSPEEAKVAAFYQAYMDAGRVEALGTKPLDETLASVRAAQTRAALAGLMGRAETDYFESLFGLGIQPDAKDPAHYAVSVRQAGLGLPDRDYYLEPKFAKQKAAYQVYVAKLLAMSGWADPDASAKAVVDLETQIAQAHWTRAESRDRDKTYNAMSVDELARAAPGVDWRALLAGADLAGVQRVVVAQNTAVPKMAAIFAAAPVPTLQAWQAFHVADNAAPVLPARFVDARFAFRNQKLQGQPEQQPRWKRAVVATNAVLGEAVGKVYVHQYFTPQAKAEMLDLVGNIKTAFGARLQKIDWMTPQTRAEAEKKLGQFNVKIAYPNTWRDYAVLQVSPGDLYGDLRRGKAFEWMRDVRRINGPVDRAEWGMTPQTVNAYYNSTLNEIVFPAAILQPPFFDPKADPAINYGGIGGVIGHEMTHGFDDQGRKSDGTGRLRDWWTADDAAKFKVQSTRLGGQYESFTPLPGAHVNGGLTMGENIADLGGLTLALDAYHASLHGAPAPVIDGLTGDQRVFLGWAQVWRGKTREDALRQQLVTDPHSPPEERVNAVVRNVDGWYAAFNVKPGDKLYVPPAERVRIW